MTAVWMRVRTELRSARWGALGLVVLVGMSGGIVLSAAAGARRTETAFPRFLAAARAGDALVSPQLADPRPLGALVGRIPGVRNHVPVATCYGLVPHPRPGAEPDPNNVYSVLAGLDGRFMYEVERPKITRGRLPDPASTTEVAANAAAVRALGARAGDPVNLDMFVYTRDGGPPDLVPLHLVVTGEVIFTNEVVPSSALDSEPTLYATPAFARATAAGSDCGGSLIFLERGASLERVRLATAALAETHPDETGGEVFFLDAHRRNDKVERAIRPQSIALWLFAALAAATAIVVVGQLLVRQVSLSAVDHPALRAVGMTRRQVFVAAMTRTAVICAAGAIVAVVIAYLASPLTPIGPARIAEPEPGFALDLVIMGLGAVGYALALVIFVALPAWLVAGARFGERGETRSRIARSLADSSLPPTASVGVSMALEPGRGRTAVPVRSALLGVSIAIAALVGATVFALSLSRLIDSPALYGWRWDMIFDTQFGALPSSLIDDVNAVPGVAGVTGGHYGDVTIGRTTMPAVGLGPGTASLFPRLTAGRAPAADGEIVLGTKVAERLRLDVGDRVQGRIGQSAAQELRVVGIGVFPSLGRGSFEPTGLGEGAAVTAAAMPDEGGAETFAYILIDVAPGADAARVGKTVEKELQKQPDCNENVCFVNTTPQQPADIANYARIRGTPLALAAALGLLAIGTLAHALLTAVRRRQRDLAVLKTLGFVRRQVSTTVVWQAATVAIVAAAMGLPAGAAAGRWAWRAFSDQLGVPSPARVPIVLIVAAVPATVLIANALAAVPARVAARTRPAVVLRSE